MYIIYQLDRHLFSIVQGFSNKNCKVSIVRKDQLLHELWCFWCTVWCITLWKEKKQWCLPFLNLWSNETRYTEADVIPCGADEPDEDNVRQALRGAVIRLVLFILLTNIIVSIIHFSSLLSSEHTPIKFSYDNLNYV